MLKLLDNWMIAGKIYVLTKKIAQILFHLSRNLIFMNKKRNVHRKNFHRYAHIWVRMFMCVSIDTAIRMRIKALILI